MTPIELLFERSGLPHFGLGPSLAAAFGGDFGIAHGHTFANFVSSLDGVVTLPGAGESGRIVSGDSDADRFVMALLRASADAILIGSGTFRHAPGSEWTAADVYPALADDFADLRRRLGLQPHPLLTLITGSGDIDTTQPAVRSALILTTPAGEARLRGRLEATTRVAVFDGDSVPLASALDRLRSEGLGRVLTEGGPALLGAMMQAQLVDELFLTTSPRLFGRRPGDGKKSLVDGVDLDGQPLDLVSVRRHESHLFLRYAAS